MSASGRDFPVVDFDTHVLEPDSIWEEYVEPAYRLAARSALRRVVGVLPEATVNGKLVSEPESGWLYRAAAWRPGLSWEEIGQMTQAELRETNPGAFDASARLRDMDAMGVDVAVLFPSVFGEYFPLVENPDVAAALARAYNDWIGDFCSADRARLLPAAVLPVQSVNEAITELHRVAAAGFKVAMLRPTFDGKRFLTDPTFEPLWAELEETGVVAGIHPYSGTTNPEWTSHGPFVEKINKMSSFPVGHPIAEAVAPQMDNTTFLITFMHYAFLERFPRVRLAMLHGKASWLPLILEKIEGYLMITFGTSFPVRVDADHVFYDHGGAMVGFDADEQTIHAVPEHFADVAVWGSRYPNHDAMSATEALERLENGGVAPATVSALMGGNASKLLNLTPVAAG